MAEAQVAWLWTDPTPTPCSQVERAPTAAAAVRAAPEAPGAVPERPAEQVLYHGTAVPTGPRQHLRARASTGSLAAAMVRPVPAGAEALLPGTTLTAPPTLHYPRRCSLWTGRVLRQAPPLSRCWTPRPPPMPRVKAVFVARVLTGDYGQGQRGQRAPSAAPPGTRSCAFYDSAGGTASTGPASSSSSTTPRRCPPTSLASTSPVSPRRLSPAP